MQNGHRHSLRTRRALLAAACLLLCSSTASALTEPDNSPVPKASQKDPVQLDDFFAMKGEPIDWKADAASTPSSFSPLCGFTATFVLHGADCPLDFAWYNETGSAPQPGDLHTIIPAGSPVGTSFTGTSIKNDPAYLGGQIGFALVGNPSQYCTQTHYSNASWNQTCTTCSTPGKWITTLIYPSKTAANAFYLAFEDGPTSASSFNNDGDFNDDVYFVSGVTCVGGGQTCDTGRSGICAAGVTQCTATGTTCQQLSQAGTEKCNGVDDDCDGQTDEGDICPTGLICHKGSCVQNCQHGEFGCPSETVCGPGGYCVDPKCKDVTCEEGKVCLDGTCKGPCDGVVCPYGQVCRVGACVDPCAGVTCGNGQVCDNGVCVTRCDCLPCAANKVCASSTGLCIESTCAGVVCAAGKHCEAGSCVGACSGVVCPTGQTCSDGQCVDVPLKSQPDGGESTSGGGLVGNGSSGTSTSDGKSDETSGGWAVDRGSSSGCGCSVLGESSKNRLALAAAALGLAAVARRRVRKGRQGRGADGRSERL